MFGRLAFFKDNIFVPALSDSIKTFMLANAFFIINHVDDLKNVMDAIRINGEVSQSFIDATYSYATYRDIVVNAVFLGSMVYRCFNTRADNQQHGNALTHGR